MSKQNTYQIQTTEGIDYLVLDMSADIREQFELYKNDEAGQHFKDAELISWERVN